jgi:1-acyl-sn-glycerol-3-phosphate acyltransferase
VFAVAPALQRWILQAQGAFSIDLDRNDLGAFRHAAYILQNSPYPLVVFPEGDITYTNDRITPFNKGAAAIALAAAKRAQRKVLCVPCALKCSYVGDPTASLLEQVRYLEERLLLRPRPDLPAPARICRLAEAVLCLKEVAYLGHAQPGPSPPRATRLAEHILAELGQRYGLSAGGKRLEVVGELRRRIKDPARWNQADSDRQRVMDDSKDLSFALGLCNYPVSYVLEYPSPERLADALDMLSAGICGDGSLRVHGERRVVCWFGEPIGVSASPARKEAEARLTATLEQRVQGILDQIAAEEQTHTRDRLRTVRHPV